LFKQKIAYERGSWLNTFSGSAENKETKITSTDAAGNEVEEDVRTAEEYFLENKLDYFFYQSNLGFLAFKLGKRSLQWFRAPSLRSAGCGLFIFS
jgi:hypothetical protein